MKYSPPKVIWYGSLAGMALLILAGILYLTESTPLRPSGDRHTTGAAASAMARLWVNPPAQPSLSEIKKLLVLCAYFSPYTRQDVQTGTETYRYLDLWDDEIRRNGAGTARAVAWQCRQSPATTDPTPPEIQRQNRIIYGVKPP